MLWKLILSSWQDILCLMWSFQIFLPVIKLLVQWMFFYFNLCFLIQCTIVDIYSYWSNGNQRDSLEDLLNSLSLFLMINVLQNLTWFYSLNLDRDEDSDDLMNQNYRFYREKDPPLYTVNLFYFCHLPINYNHYQNWVIVILLHLINLSRCSGFFFDGFVLWWILHISTFLRRYRDFIDKDTRYLMIFFFCYI